MHPVLKFNVIVACCVPIALAPALTFFVVASFWQGTRPCPCWSIANVASVFELPGRPRGSRCKQC